MPALAIASLLVVVLAALHLIALGAVSLLFPARATRFLLGFASTSLAHVAELLARVAAGAAFVHHAPNMALSGVFSLFGWVLLATSAFLLILPWRWHRRFAQQAVARASRHLHLVGAASIALGGLILHAVWRGATG